MRNIGFIGLGAMGAPMAGCLSAAGFELAVFDVDGERTRATAEESGARAASSAADAAREADALVELVQRLDPGLPLAFCVAKGGITSSDIGTRGFGVRRAEVAGQMLPGTISVWILPDDSAFPGLPYVIFPGNVGEAETLAEVIERLAT